MVKLFGVALIIALGSFQFAAAQENGGIIADEGAADVEPNSLGAACHPLANSLSRLACYDEQTGYEAPTVAPVTGGWQFVENEDEFSNENTSFVYLQSDAAGGPMSDAPESLVVRCDGNGGAEIYIRSGGYIGARRNTIPVRFRFGEDAPVSERWNESTNGQAAFLPQGYRDFRAGLASRRGFVFELTDFRGSRSSARFDGLDRNDDRLEFVLNGCR